MEKRLVGRSSKLRRRGMPAQNGIMSSSWRPILPAISIRGRTTVRSSYDTSFSSQCRGDPIQVDCALVSLLLSFLFDCGFPVFKNLKILYNLAWLASNERSGYISQTWKVCQILRIWTIKEVAADSCAKASKMPQFSPPWQTSKVLPRHPKCWRLQPLSIGRIDIIYSKATRIDFIEKFRYYNSMLHFQLPLLTTGLWFPLVFAKRDAGLPGLWLSSWPETVFRCKTYCKIWGSILSGTLGISVP